MKKILLGLGSLATIATPVAVVVSCGDDKPDTIPTSVMNAKATGFIVEADGLKTYFPTGAVGEMVSFKIPYDDSGEIAHITLTVKEKLTIAGGKITVTNPGGAKGDIDIAADKIAMATVKDIVLTDDTGVYAIKEMDAMSNDNEHIIKFINTNLGSGITADASMATKASADTVAKINKLFMGVKLEVKGDVTIDAQKMITGITLQAMGTSTPGGNPGGGTGTPDNTPQAPAKIPPVVRYASATGFKLGVQTAAANPITTYFPTGAAGQSITFYDKASPYTKTVVTTKTAITNTGGGTISIKRGSAAETEQVLTGTQINSTTATDIVLKDISGTYLVTYDKNTSSSKQHIYLKSFANSNISSIVEGSTPGQASENTVYAVNKLFHPLGLKVSGTLPVTTTGSKTALGDFTVDLITGLGSSVTNPGAVGFRVGFNLLNGKTYYTYFPTGAINQTITFVDMDSPDFTKAIVTTKSAITDDGGVALEALVGNAAANNFQLGDADVFVPDASDILFTDDRGVFFLDRPANTDATNPYISDYANYALGNRIKPDATTATHADADSVATLNRLFGAIHMRVKGNVTITNTNGVIAITPNGITLEDIPASTNR